MNIRHIQAGAAGLAFAALLATSAQAQTGDVTYYPDQGFYLFGNIGIHDPMDSDIEGGGINTEAELEQGFVGLTGLGYDFGDAWRLELEGGYRESDIDEIGGASATGDTEALSAMANIFYDFDLGGGIEPYIGAGFGMTQVSVDGASPIGGGNINDDDWGWAVQAGAGLAIPLNRRVKLTADYRFLSVQDLSYTTSTGTGVDADYNDHAVMIGIRIALNPPPPPAPVAQPVAQPAPPPAPAPAPAPVREFLVFFDFDSSVITPQASSVLAEAVENARRLGNTRIVATGHADRSGPADYNIALSQRRAAAVQAEL
ncbi:MAG: OmpA family protein, partial [Alphaproteobacteria bacterium]|nr:OmpA family protein [Alphaproteobacteria bacterium]